MLFRSGFIKEILEEIVQDSAREYVIENVGQVLTNEAFS